MGIIKSTAVLVVSLAALSQATIVEFTVDGKTVCVKETEASNLVCGDPVAESSTFGLESKHELWHREGEVTTNYHISSDKDLPGGVGNMSISTDDAGVTYIWIFSPVAAMAIGTWTDASGAVRQVRYHVVNNQGL